MPYPKLFIGLTLTKSVFMLEPWAKMPFYFTDAHPLLALDLLLFSFADAGLDMGVFNKLPLELQQMILHIDDGMDHVLGFH